MLEVTPELKTLFINKLSDLLLNGKKRTVTKSRKTRKFIYSLQPETDMYILTGKEVTYTDDTATYDDGIPEFALKMIFDSMSLEYAIKILEQNGYLILDPTATKEEENKGLTDKAANEIKEKLLGIK